MTNTKHTNLAIVGAIVAVLLLPLTFWVVRVAFADQIGAGNQKLKTRADANYRISQYDHFYDLCGDVQAAEDRLDTARQMLAASPADERFQANVAATTNQRLSLVRTYNADASKTDTAAHFRASDLPFSIDPTQEHTTCAR